MVTLNQSKLGTINYEGKKKVELWLENNANYNIMKVIEEIPENETIIVERKGNYFKYLNYKPISY